ncbi:GtrA family protein [Cupriavidus necator]|uniref:GtrA/DPMS transmembrane domain-containing protein n=1 Tax=Cupriavidus pinatubonensis (strain JMP 134 / LMG 1197) TaxID=264198 RepID=Q474S4_CUPPJ|nr:GtrA family protein [Cupriavidus necator]
MDRLRSLIRLFLGFALLSGVGWLCDMLTFVLLDRVFGVPVFVANMVSSYVGVTFVWFASLKAVFSQQSSHHSGFLLIYWGFQFCSILLYSQLMHFTANTLHAWPGIAPLAVGVGILAKIIITPFNLVTNFLFMKLLVRFMDKKKHAYV